MVRIQHTVTVLGLGLLVCLHSVNELHCVSIQRFSYLLTVDSQNLENVY